MHADVGDQLVRQGRRFGRGEILGVVTEVRGEDGAPPYVVRWYSDGHESLMTPDPRHFWIRGENVLV